MIKIKIPNIESLAIRHFRSIENYLSNANKANQINAQNKKIKNVFGSEYDFKKIVLATPVLIEHLISIFKNKNSEEFKYLSTTLYNEFSSGKKLLIENEKGEKLSYNAFYLVECLKINVCPYCNRNFIFNTDKNGRRTCDIDHFFPKNRFPFLAISFYNLIPACKSCNFLKLDKWNTQPSNYLIHPFDKENKFDSKFKVKILDNQFYYNPKSIQIEFTTTNCQRTQNHIEAFHLKNLYQGHARYAMELVQKKHSYTDKYINSLFSKYEGTLFKNRSDILRFITTNYTEENNLHNRPLAKFTRDIFNQLADVR